MLTFWNYSFTLTNYKHIAIYFRICFELHYNLCFRDYAKPILNFDPTRFPFLFVVEFLNPNSASEFHSTGKQISHTVSSFSRDFRLPKAVTSSIENDADKSC